MKKSMKENKLWVFLCIGIIILFTLNILQAGCSNEGKVSKEAPDESKDTEGLPYESQELVISGSTTLLQVSEAWASAFMEKYGGTIIINGGGSGGGIADMINGINELANSSREIKDGELEAAKSAGLDVQEYTVLYDGIAVIVRRNVPVDSLTIEELSKIYAGEITSWKDVGGSDSKIVIIARDSSSGTGEYFLEEVVQLGKTMEDNDYSETALRLQSNADIVYQIKNNDNAIGYIGLGYLEKSLKIIKVEGVEPLIDTVEDGSYPISRGLYIYSPGKELTQIGQAYIDFILSDEGQEIGSGQGFVPVK